MDTSTKKALKAQAHHLKPVILLGAKGLTEAVIAETDIALQAHELIKVKISGTEKEDRIIMADELALKVQAELVQLIGNTVILYRKNGDTNSQRTVKPPKADAKKRRR
ncbi:MAG: ribosome assembly RNA-binding protein YhbY [Legionella sp.]|jgi:RNA-binding protein